MDVAECIAYFPMGEAHAKLPANVSHGDIWIKYSWPSDVMQLLLTVDALRRRNPHRQISLLVPYLPFARQDRQTSDSESFSLKVFADVLALCRFRTVLTFDPHSDVAAALIPNLEFEEQHSIAIEAVEDFVPTCLVSPDAGATKKIAKLSQATGLPILHCGKHREVSTGRLSGFWYNRDTSLDMSRCLLVDDICDGGGTFIGLADRIKEDYPQTVFGLYVTHGGFSKGLAPLFDVFQNVYCSNSLPLNPQDRLSKKVHVIHV